MNCKRRVLAIAASLILLVFVGLNWSGRREVKVCYFDVTFVLNQQAVAALTVNQISFMCHLCVYTISLVRLMRHNAYT